MRAMGLMAAAIGVLCAEPASRRWPRSPRTRCRSRVVSFEPVEPPSPRVVSGLDELDANPSKWDRQRIVYEGSYVYGFETSALDKVIWLGFRPSTTGVRSTAPPPNQKVRVTGYPFARPGDGYGHLGAYRYLLVADAIEYR